MGGLTLSVGLESLGVLHGKVAAHNLVSSTGDLSTYWGYGMERQLCGRSFFYGFGQCISRAADMAAGQHAHPDACSLAAVRPRADDGMFLVAYLG